MWDTPPRSCPGGSYPFHGGEQEVEGPSKKGTRHRERPQEVHSTSRRSPVKFYNHPGSIRVLAASCGDSYPEVIFWVISCTNLLRGCSKSKMTAYMNFKGIILSRPNNEDIFSKEISGTGPLFWRPPATKMIVLKAQ